jgi:glycolate oxidase FAD binding subunit
MAGRVLRFGGQVMKNVAGYDVSRLIAGSFGTCSA